MVSKVRDAALTPPAFVPRATNLAHADHAILCLPVALLSDMLASNAVEANVSASHRSRMCAQVESEVTELILGRDNDPSKRRSKRGSAHGGVQATRFRAPRRACAAGGRGRSPEWASRGGYGRIPGPLLGGPASGAQ